MNKLKVTQIAKNLNVSHSAVSQWLSGKTLPSMDKVIKMNELYNIPFEAWKDIKSYINSNLSSIEDKNQLQKENEK